MFEIDSNAVTMIERFGSQFRADGLSVTTPVRIFHACFCKIGSVSAWRHKGSIMQPTAKDDFQTYIPWSYPRIKTSSGNVPVGFGRVYPFNNSRISLRYRLSIKVDDGAARLGVL